VLRATAGRGSERTLRASALIALGRMGEAQDALLFVNLLRDSKQPRAVREGAALALGILPSVGEGRLLETTRNHLVWALDYRGTLPDRARGMAVLAAGLRSRGDPLLRMRLLGRTMARVADGEDAANLAFACGLAADPMAVPELVRGARKGVFAGRRLTDVERSHAVQALGLSGDPGVVSTLEMVLRSRRVGLQSRRGAALALARVLREEQPSTAAVDRAEGILVRVLSKSSDTLLRGYCALALGGARPPRALLPLREAIDHGGNMDLKPFCALALGLAARSMREEHARRGIQTFWPANSEKPTRSNWGRRSAWPSVWPGRMRLVDFSWRS